MPLNKKDNVDESRGGESGSALGNEARERLDELAAQVDGHDDVINELYELHEERRRDVSELRDRVDQQQAVLYELIDTVEVLASVSDWNEFAEAMNHRVPDEGSDAYPFEWDSETLEFKAGRFE